MLPIYDLNKNIEDVIILNETQSDSDIARADQSSSIILNRDFLNNTHNSTLYITDSIFNMLAIQDRLCDSVIVINSIEGLNQQVKKKPLSSLSSIENKLLVKWIGTCNVREI